ncbi:hypothetical protein BATDEDRAFT_18214 [Batrachochytrium dendrobatidis JAM81]|uniref:PX domain-containing protein n=2 Tax=Batrachochytrium dendrobatidis TaxID=109871 RepID=F4NS62_BATDJ|nr:uncharacterized protein BATDEDRAFT_18214 [Batrachochytrium dendrobatidis JAM81]EGF83794.1 hypothetical protein BATDEDRAFT_18214 [Batrachochytrium dendrobatidis JAM81]KAJ8331615.1 hypothetical protein O5D80_000523 [Batrachochytrium dendrobatidis]KAK5672065.1 hypothetical protein QVD99_001880 [Batrachochytrium dendrobatidis]OAJ35936.1 hypothetical protein BDEG_20161 [Batrachochytrium dendrobatidis JEL423]|eukprot:XP_006675157.1 hypothetical protein BATDEDRAFT_18214 [Batrachochytrium dendrobatidis JAM81]
MFSHPPSTTSSNLAHGNRVAEPINSLCIPLTEERDSPSKHTVYKLVMKGQVREWSVWRRYSEFDALNRQLLALFPDPPSLSAQLPNKSLSLFSNSLIGFATDPAKVEARRIALEAYLQAILYAKDTRWRRSDIWMDFLNIPGSLRASDAKKSKEDATGHVLVDSDNWIHNFHDLQLLVTDIRTEINARTRSAETYDASTVQSKNVQLRKSTSLATDRLNALESALKISSDTVNSGSRPVGMTAAYATKGEIRRRQDLLANLKEDIAQVTRAALTTPTMQPRSAKESSDRQNLFGTTSANHSPFSRIATSVKTMRKFGVANVQPQETDETRSLDNSGILQLQRDTMHQQDAELDSLAFVVQRQREIGLTIGKELDSQNQLLDEVNTSVNRVETNLKTSDKKLGRILGKK